MTSSDTLQTKPQQLQDLISYQAGSVVSREIVKTAHTTITLFAFAEGQGLSEHTTPFTALVQVFDGSAEITIGGKKHQATEGEIILMPTNIPHALHATQAFKMMLTMAK